MHFLFATWNSIRPDHTDRDFTVATIASPGGAQDAEDDAAAAEAAAAEGGEAEEASE